MEICRRGLQGPAIRRINCSSTSHPFSSGLLGTKNIFAMQYKILVLTMELSCESGEIQEKCG